MTKEKKGVIYILTNPSFEEYVKIGYADDMDAMMNDFRSKAETLEEMLEGVANSIKDINTAMEESAQGVYLVTENTGNLVQLLGAIGDDAKNNREISEGLQAEVERFKEI